MTKLVDVLSEVARDVKEHADKLNTLDAAAGDGDLGVTMTLAADAVLGALPQLSNGKAGDVLTACGAQIAREAPSTSGTLVATALLAAGRELRSREDLALSDLLEVARASIAARGKAEAGDKTLLDALGPAVAAARSESDLHGALAAAAEAAHEGARATATMTPRHGRAGWLAERSAGHEDAGAHLVALILSSAAAHVSTPGVPS